MQVVNIHEAKTHLSRLIEQAAKGESFIIAKAGKPMVQVTALQPSPPPKIQRLGFMQGEYNIPADFDQMGKSEIEYLFKSDT